MVVVLVVGVLGQHNNMQQKKKTKHCDTRISDLEARLLLWNLGFLMGMK